MAQQLGSNYYNSPYKFNGKELDEETGFYYYGARYYDPRISVWQSVDPLAEKYPEVSPYVYCMQNPVNIIDPDGNFIVSAEFARKFPNITKYLKNNIKSDVLNSKIIMSALYNATAKDSPDGKSGNLTREAMETILTFGKGPKIVSSKAPGGLKGANGWYNDQNKSLDLNEDKLKNLETILASPNSDCTSEDKTQALLGGFMLIIHETAHYGDLLDGLQQENDEPGFNVENNVWWWDNPIDKMPTAYPTDKFNPSSQGQVIDKKKNDNVTPTLPNIQNKENKN